MPRERTACLLVHLGFAGGGMALLDLASSPGDQYDSLTVIGTDGAAHAEDHRNVQLLYSSQGLKGMLVRGDSELALLRAFASGAYSAASEERSVSTVTEAVAESCRICDTVAVSTP